jgi:hypothetical protein
MTFWMKTLIALKTRFEILVEKSLDLWSNFHYVICWYEKAFENCQGWPQTSVAKFKNVYLKINLKDMLMKWLCS